MRKPKIIGRFRLVLALGLMNGMLSPGLAIAQTVTPSWTLTGDLNTARYGHTATLLPNGKVLVAGGVGPNSCSTTTSTAELYDPVSGTWSHTGSLNAARVGHTATLLQNGQVLVAGGYFLVGGHAVYLNSAELYDPATGTWRPTGSFKTGGAATLLPNGKVLVLGGELYDPATGTWSSTGAHSMPWGGPTVLLPNGKVLAVWEGSPWDNYYGGLFAELYDPATGQWSATSFLNGMHFANTLTLLRNGKVLITGHGGAAHLYETTTGTWSVTGNLSTSSDTATLQADGRVLVAGGNISNGLGNQAELYDPTVGTWSSVSGPIVPRVSYTGTLLRNGKTLIVGGAHARFLNGCDASILESAELFDPGNISTTNPIDDPQFFVRQHYLDFLNREPDPAGYGGWLSILTGCSVGDTSCDRIHVSGAFFQSPEFQQRGYFVYRFYPVALGRKPDYNEFTPDLAKVSGFLTDAELEAAKLNFLAEFINRPAFVTKFNGLDNTAYVDSLLTTAGITHPSRDLWIAALAGGTKTRAQVLREIVESTEVYNKYYNQAFVVMQYFGYLRRDPDILYLNWIAVLDANPADSRHMIAGFVNSLEYRARFGP